MPNSAERPLWAARGKTRRPGQSYAIVRGCRFTSGQTPQAGTLASPRRLGLDGPWAGEMSEPSSGWGRQFDEPIVLPNGRNLVSLRDAANYITALPKKEANAPEWQAAIEALIKVVAKPGGPAMFARIGMMQALNRHSAKAEPAPRQKWARAYRVIRRSR